LTHFLLPRCFFCRSYLDRMSAQNLRAAIKCRSLVQVKEILLAQPGFDVNADIWRGENCLHSACRWDAGHIVSWLLTQKGIDVNRKSTTAPPLTALSITCEYHSTTALLPLLEDPRTRVDILDDGLTLAWRAVFYCGTWFTRALIACDRAIDWDTKCRYLDSEECTPLELSRAEKEESERTRMLEFFGTNPAAAKHEARVSLRLPIAVAAGLFADVVFISDDLLVVKNFTTPASMGTAGHSWERRLLINFGRFFCMAARLPLDLQGLLCLRFFGSRRSIIPTGDAEIAFRHLAYELSTRPRIS